MRPRVYFYTENFAPRAGSGAHMRVLSNLRAYLDLGYSVEWVQLRTTGCREEAASDLPPHGHTVVHPDSPLLSKAGWLAYVLGLVTEASWNFYFRTASSFRKEAEKREKATPGALHHFELPLAGSAISLLRGMNTIWSCADIESDYVGADIRLTCDRENRRPHGWEKRKLRFVRRAERVIARKSSLVLCIADHEAERMRNKWGCRHAEFLAISVPDEQTLPREGWLQGGKLNLVHLGSLAHFPTYRSLEFLLEQVFPLLDPQTRERIQLNVVGQISGDGHVRRLLESGKKWPQVRFMGFVDDIRTVCAQSDLHIVASTEATGLRTRIVEAFAWGVPVISTAVGARGIAGLRPGENIVIADTPQEYANALSRLSMSPEALAGLSREGRQTYDSMYSRQRVSEHLSSLLATYFS